MSFGTLPYHAGSSTNTRVADTGTYDNMGYLLPHFRVQFRLGKAYSYCRLTVKIS